MDWNQISINSMICANASGQTYFFATSIANLNLLAKIELIGYTFSFLPAKNISSPTPNIPSRPISVACPPLFPPLHGYLECSRPIENSSVMSTGRPKITNRPGSQCVLRCPTRFNSFIFRSFHAWRRIIFEVLRDAFSKTWRRAWTNPANLPEGTKVLTHKMFSSHFIKSYRASGTFVKTCGEDGKWRGDDDGICISK